MINKNRVLQNSIIILLFGVFFLAIQGGFRFGISFLALSILLLVISSSVYNHTYRIGSINKIYFFLSTLFTLSVFYAIDSSYTTDVLIAVYSTNIVMFILYNYFNEKDKLLKIISYMLLIAVVFSGINAIMSPIGSRELFYGPVNPVGFAMYICIILSIWMGLNKKHVFLLFIPLFLYVLFLTGSQKSILSLCVVFLVYLFLLLYKLRIKILFKILISILLTSFIIIFYFSKQEALQRAFIRTSATIESLYTGEKVASSAGGSAGEGLRPYLRDKGIQYIKRNPFIGYGINNFRPLLKDDVGFETYSHNTPIELAISIGVLGVFLYYSIFIILFIRLFKLYNITKNIDNLFFISSLVGVIIIGMYMQLYFDVFAHIFIIIVFSFVRLQEEEIKSSSSKITYHKERNV